MTVHQLSPHRFTCDDCGATVTHTCAYAEHPPGWMLMPWVSKITERFITSPGEWPYFAFCPNCRAAHTMPEKNP